jgi:hypothetical protein
VADDAVEPVAAVGEDAGQELAQPRQLAARSRHAVQHDEHERDDRDRDPDHAPGRLEQHDDHDDAGGDVGGDEEAGAGDDRVEVEEQVAAAVQGAGDEGAVDDPAEGPRLRRPIGKARNAISMMTSRWKPRW